MRKIENLAHLAGASLSEKCAAAEKLGISLATLYRRIAASELSGQTPAAVEPATLRWFFGGTPNSHHQPVLRLVPWPLERCLAERTSLRAQRDAHWHALFDIEHAYDGREYDEMPNAMKLLVAAENAFHAEQAERMKNYFEAVDAARRAENAKQHAYLDELRKTWTNPDGTTILPPGT